MSSHPLVRRIFQSTYISSESKDIVVFTNLLMHFYSGGGFDSGASSDPKIDGSFLAAKGVVFASYNYRLSLWAWPHAQEIADAGETQNFGLLDTRAAVEWIRDNAETFGGDPTKITLGGKRYEHMIVVSSTENQGERRICWSR